MNEFLVLDCGWKLSVREKTHKKIQPILYALGYKWACGEPLLSYTEKRYLSLWNDKEICYSNSSDGENEVLQISWMGKD